MISYIFLFLNYCRQFLSDERRLKGKIQVYLILPTILTSLSSIILLRNYQSLNIHQEILNEIS